MITCRELVELLDEYISGDMPAARVGAFREHLAACPECVNYLNSYRRTIRLGRMALAKSDAPAAVPEDLLKAVLMATRKNP
jgi:anti-sigma factor RsiW